MARRRVAWPCSALLGTAVMVFLMPRTSLAASANENMTMTVDAGVCSAFDIADLPEKFRYNARLYALSLPPLCARSSVAFSKFYIRDACIPTRNNENPVTKASDLTCNKAGDSSSSTCNRVFTNNAANVVSASSLTVPQTIDGGNVCAAEDEGFVYVVNNCSLAISVTVAFETSSYSGGLCFRVAGHRISAWAISVTAIGGFIILAVAAWLFLCCCCNCCKPPCCCCL